MDTSVRVAVDGSRVLRPPYDAENEIQHGGRNLERCLAVRLARMGTSAWIYAHPRKRPRPPARIDVIAATVIGIVSVWPIVALVLHALLLPL